MEKNEQALQICNNLLFPKIFKTFRMAIQPSKLIIAFAAIAMICFAGWVMDFTKSVVTENSVQGGQRPFMYHRTPMSPYNIRPVRNMPGQTELDVYMVNPNVLPTFIVNNKASGQRKGVFNVMWHFAETKFQGVLDSMVDFNISGVIRNIADFLKGLGWVFWYHPIYFIIFGAIKLAIISVAGGAICRLAALQFAKDEKPGLTEALHFATKRFASFFTAPLIPLAIIGFIGLLIFISGLLGNIPRAGELIIALTMPLSLLGGVLIAVISIGVMAGFNLMPPAIAYDGSDAFDAISRSFSYIYAKPWRMGFYSILAMIYGAICYIFVRFFAFLLLFSSHQFLQLGVFVKAGTDNDVNKLNVFWPRPEFLHLLFNFSSLENLNWSQYIASFLIYLSVLFVVGLLISFLISFYFSANTIIYSLMRNRVDKALLTDIYNPNNLDNELNPIKSVQQPLPEQTTEKSNDFSEIS